MRLLKDLLRSPTVAAVLLVTGLGVVFNSGPSNGTVYKWSTTASSNATADASINWAEGMAPSAVNDSARAMMAAVAKWRDDSNGAVTTGGTSTAYTLTSNQSFISLSTMSGQRLCFVPHATNGATVTLNVDTLGAKALRSAPSVELPAGVLVQGTPYCATYNNSNSEWVLNGLASIAWQLPIGAILDYAGSTAPNSNFVMAFGQCISRSVYAALFALFSTTYNNGCGGSDFGVPDLRGRVVAGKDNMGGFAASRITNGGSGISATNLGAVGGTENVTLSAGNIPTLTSGNFGHNLSVNTTITNGGSVFIGTDLQNNVEANSGSINGVPKGATSTTLSLNSGTVSGLITYTNSSPSAVNNMPPAIILNKILRVL